jgi:hypothetical protein
MTSYFEKYKWLQNNEDAIVTIKVDKDNTLYTCAISYVYIDEYFIAFPFNKRYIMVPMQKVIIEIPSSFIEDSSNPIFS